MNGNIARVIPGDGLLLERVFMLFVKNNQPEIRRGSKNGAARPNNDLDGTFRNPLPLIVPFWTAHVRVQHSHRAKSILEARTRLRCQANLGHKHDRLTTVGNDLFHRLHVDFGLAAAGHSVQENRFMLA